MEALKKAEQSKQKTEEAALSAQNALNEVIADESTQHESSQQDEQDEQNKQKLDIGEIPEIEDPNTELNQLEWYFNLEDEHFSEQPVEQAPEQETIEHVALELESVEILPEHSQPTLLEQAELAEISVTEVADTELATELTQLVDTNEKKSVEQVDFSDDELEWDAGIFAPDTFNGDETFKNPDQVDFTGDELDWDASIFASDNAVVKTQVIEKSVKIDTKPIPETITHPDSLTAKHIFRASKQNYSTVPLLLLILLIGFIGYFAYQLNLLNSAPQETTESKQAALPESTQPPVIEKSEDTQQTFMVKAQSLLSNMIKENVSKQSVEVKTVQYKPAAEEIIEPTKSIQRTTTLTRAQQPLITNAIIDTNEKQPPLLPQQQDNKDIKIKKTSRHTQHLHSQLTRAYQAFQEGQTQKAQRLYQQILNQHDKNRDALLGLAAIAQRDGQTQAAEYYYQQILKYYPDDGIAQLGLNVMQQQSPQGSESQIKMLLDQSPQSAYLHFSLGNAYAQQQRWREAQQAYFDAYRFDEQKADYAYNLAVSLEYLHQSKAALPFYQKALELSQHQTVQFDPKQVKKRVQQLNFN